VKHLLNCLLLISLFQPMNLIADQERSKIKIAVLYDDEFILHNTGPNHPENPDRLSSVINFLKNDSKLQLTKM
jgi:hypothetical protein